ncbi:MAG: hypothetical protein ACFCD0_01290 [Gemmataceae bacterium]
MPWIVGIDEAGYGPNLGPFVMTSVACRFEGPTDTDFWQLLKPAVRRPKDKRDGRLLIEDSKVVHAGVHGLRNLERGIFGGIGGLPTHLDENAVDPNPLLLDQWIETISPTRMMELREEFWYTGQTVLPLESSPSSLHVARQLFEKTCKQASLDWGPPYGIVVCPSRFNGILDRTDNKAVVVLHCLAQLLRHYLVSAEKAASFREEPIHFVVDKQGGRNRYAQALEQAIPKAAVVIRSEGNDLSHYELESLDRPVEITFRPKADQHYFSVALASMLAKYIREVLMGEFNAFWQQHLPELKPTAGYPVDAARFMEEIRDVAQTLAIDENAIWRRK